MPVTMKMNNTESLEVPRYLYNPEALTQFQGMEMVFHTQRSIINDVGDSHPTGTTNFEFRTYVRCFLKCWYPLFIPQVLSFLVGKPYWFSGKPTIFGTPTYVQHLLCWNLNCPMCWSQSGGDRSESLFFVNAMFFFSRLALTPLVFGGNDRSPKNIPTGRNRKQTATWKKWLWIFQFDESKALHGKVEITNSIHLKKRLFGVAGRT